MYLVKFIGYNDTFWRYRPFNTLEDAQLFMKKCKQDQMICALYREVVEE